MSHPVDEMKMAAELTAHENFMGVCEGGFPLVAFEPKCRFCDAGHNEKCRRLQQTRERT